MADTTDAFKKITGQALSLGLKAAGAEAVDPLVDPFMNLLWPPDPIEFSEAELTQLHDVVKDELSAYSDNRDEATLEGLNNSLNEYMKYPGSHSIQDLSTQTNNLAIAIMGTDPNKSYTHAKVYLAAACQHLTCLKLEYSIAKAALAKALSNNLSGVEEKKDLSGAEEIICGWLKEMLSRLLTFERQLLTDQGFELFSDFMQYLLYGQEQPTQTVNWFGSDYRENVIKLLLYSKFLLKQDDFKVLPAPKYVLNFFHIPEEPIWSSNGKPIHFFTCEPEKGYYPIGDVYQLNTCEFQEYIDVLTLHVTTPRSPYIKLYDPGSYLEHPDKFDQIYNDHGSGNPQDYSAWNFSSSKNPKFVQISTVNGQGYSQPDLHRICLFDKADTNQVGVGSSCWDDSGTGANQDCIVYSHPQFGKWGLYNLFRSHSHYTGTVSIFKTELFIGHPILDEKVVTETLTDWLTNESTTPSSTNPGNSNSLQSRVKSFLKNHNLNIGN